jgi:crossover junction endodeoxyribonuclease RuvC
MRTPQSARDIVVLGIDPGSRHFGWGVVQRIGTRLVHLAHGTIHPALDGTFADRLVEIEAALVLVVEQWSPTHVGVEGLFFAKDAMAAAKLGHARGVALLVCARAGLPIVEYPPARVKRTVAGGGRAAKGQVAQMVRAMLGLRETPVADAADALAVALTHLADRRTEVLAAMSTAARRAR